MPHSFSEAYRLLLDAVERAGSEIIPAEESFGRILARDLPTSRPFPDIHKSAVDGYAVADIHRKEFRIIGTSAAGAEAPPALNENQALAVMTGAPLPPRTKAVIRVEDCRCLGETLVLEKTENEGENIVLPGEEMKKGERFASSGFRIDNTLYPALFAAGIAGIEVFRQPRVGILVSGDELINAGDPFRPGAVYDTNRYILESVFRSLHVSYGCHRVIGDSEKETAQTLDKMFDSYDLIVTTGGVSMGKFDYLKTVLHYSQYERLIDGTHIKPGRPMIAARRGGKFIFAMPGYPAALTTNVFLYLIPVLKKMYGYENHEHRRLDVEMEESVTSKRGRFDVQRACVRVRNGKLTAKAAVSQKTSHFLNFADVNALLLLDERIEFVQSGGRVSALIFEMEYAG